MPIAPDPWTELRRHTAARIALGRAGASLPTAPWLQFSLAHALARDAVHALPDVAALQAQLAAHDLPSTAVESAAADRTIYLRRPDFGRRLSARSAAMAMNVQERFREIGTLRAIGIRRSGLERMFLVEGLVMGLAGCLIACVPSTAIGLWLGVWGIDLSGIFPRDIPIPFGTALHASYSVVDALRALTA